MAVIFIQKLMILREKKFCAKKAFLGRGGRVTKRLVHGQSSGFATSAPEASFYSDMQSSEATEEGCTSCCMQVENNS